MPDRDELTRRDAEAWRRFEALLAAVPTGRRETPDLEGGWSVKDVLWHVGFWWDDFRRTVENGEAAADDGDESTDDVNHREQERSRSMSWNEVRTAVRERRRAMLEAWLELPDVDDRVAESFIAETVEHYDEHEPQLRELLDADDD
jgi:uncharacterized damage-inducible protein DinB